MKEAPDRAVLLLLQYASELFLESRPVVSTTASDIREAMRRTQAHIVRQFSESRIVPLEADGIAREQLRAFGQFAQNTKARQDAALRNSVLEMAGSTGLEPATSGLTVLDLGSPTCIGARFKRAWRSWL